MAGDVGVVRGSVAVNCSVLLQCLAVCCCSVLLQCVVGDVEV